MTLWGTALEKWLNQTEFKKKMLSLMFKQCVTSLKMQ